MKQKIMENFLKITHSVTKQKGKALLNILNLFHKEMLHDIPRSAWAK